MDEMIFIIVNYIVNFIVPIIIVCIAIIFFMLYRRNTEFRARQERIDFTSREIERAFTKMESHPPQFKGQNMLPIGYDDLQLIIEENGYRFSLEQFNSTYAILSVFNKIALAIGQGLYDANYVEIMLGDEIRTSYKQSLPLIRDMRKLLHNDELFLEIELLLHELDKTKARYDLRVIRKGRRYL